MQRNDEKCREMLINKYKWKEMQRNVVKCREMKKNGKKCSEIQRNVAVLQHILGAVALDPRPHTLTLEYDNFDF